MNKKSDYWTKRAIRDSVKMFLTTEETEKLIDQAYDHEERLLTDEIHKLLKRTQIKSGYDVDKLIRILQEEVPTSELLLLNEAVKTTTDKKRRKELRTMLNLLAIQYRISRLDVLHAKAAILAKKIGEQQEKLSTRLFREIINDTYQEEQQNLTECKEEPMDPTVILDEDHHPHPLVQLTDDTQPKPPKGTTVTKPDITTPKEVPKAEMETLLSSKWKGANFSQRIWKDTDELARKLQQLFTVEQMTGMAEKDIAKEIEYLISDAFLLHKNIARRLVRTEANRFHTQAKIQQWQKMGLKHVKYVAVLDNRTSHICMELDGAIFRLDELETGKNCPPMHPWCRSIIQAYFGEVVDIDAKEPSSWDEAKKDIDTAWLRMTASPLESEKLKSLFNNKYYIGSLPNEERMGVLKNTRVVIEDHNFAYILSKHWGQFTKEEFLRMREVIQSPQLLAKDPKGNENTFVLINKISENAYMDIVLTRKQEYTLIHLTVKKGKKH